MTVLTRDPIAERTSARLHLVEALANTTVVTPVSNELTYPVADDTIATEPHMKDEGELTALEAINDQIFVGLVAP